MRDTKQCSPLSKKVVNFLFLVVLQSFLLGQCDKAKISSERSSPATINSVDTTSTNSVGSDSGSVGDLGSIEENEKVDDQSDKSKEPCDKIENQLNTKKLLLQCKARWDRVKKKSESSQKKEIQALSPSEAKGFLENAMTTDDISLFKKILKHRMPVPFTSEDLLEVLNNVVPRSPLPELSQKISQKFREMATILLQLLNQHNVSKELLYKPDLISGRTAFHYFAICADIDIWERLLKQLKEMKIGLDCLSIPDWNRQTPLHYLASLGCSYFIWESILGELIKDSTNKFMLSLQDKTGTTPLHYIVQKHYKNNILEIILGIISENDLSLEDKDGRTPLHLLFLTQQQHSKIEDFKILFIQIRDKLGCDLVVDTLLKKDKKR
ncbi:ankyrin repeat domain-containing protein [Candidatus Cardinium sp. cByotN1]|uniref:ankyrin repeat domain-containing protein n=1 Tax=Candidatus Cardinium sp. cByotN1 TaxID=2699439 RepID=UPI001FB2B2FB|nr:ankyrin repeat domain-containing protein [Candidatus Cardinium sp. cByotN1]